MIFEHSIYVGLTLCTYADSPTSAVGYGRPRALKVADSINRRVEITVLEMAVLLVHRLGWSAIGTCILAAQERHVSQSP